MMPADADPCPCGGAAFGSCCGPLLGGESARTAEALMRSRYSAHVLGDSAHLRRSWAAETCPKHLTPDPEVRWLGLKVLASRGGPGDTVGEVEFVARSKRGGRASRLHETSHFRRAAHGWVYVDGTVHPDSR